MAPVAEVRMTAAAPAPATERGWPHAAMAGALFFLLAADVLSLFLGKLIEGRPLSDARWSILG